MDKKYDIGVLGVWSGCNYGSIMTYYALNRMIEGMGKSVLMIDKPILKPGNDVEHEDTHSRRFAKEYYNISPAYTIPEFKKYNDMCDGFILGSDQLWNYGISRNFGKAFYLDFAEPQKRRVAYATSFGHEVDFAPPEERKIITKYMRDFNAISLREDDGVKLCRDVYGVDSQQVLDPVFMVDRKTVYDPLIEKSSHYKPEGEEEPFICAYILDPTPEKREALLKLSEKLGGIKIICLLDGLFWLFEENKQKMNLDNCIENLQVEDWLYYLSRARYVVTDSCHGASFAMIFGREFTAITNKRRGFSRFRSLGNLYDCHNRIVTDVSKIMTDDSLLEPVDYNKINSIMERERERCNKWLDHALNCPIEEKVRPITLSSEKVFPPLSSDYARSKMLMSVLNQYGIKNIVVSSGKRYLPLIKCFEAEQSFRIYSCADEKSAGYYAIGLSKRTGEPVAVCADAPAEGLCSAVKTAKSENVPLIIITADIPENERIGKKLSKYGAEIGTVEKVTLPIDTNSEAEEESRRLICSAAVNVRRNGGGPVQINIPLGINEKLPEPEQLKIDRRYRTVELISSTDSASVWKSRAGRLKQMNRVLLVCGFSKPLSNSEKESIDKFAQNYNVTVVTNSLSNYSGEYSVSANKILRRFGNEEFNNRLWADVVITVGKEISPDGLLTERLSKQTKSLGQWAVSQNVSAENPYGCLMRLFDCSPKYFFDMFNRFAEGKNNGAYFEDWKKAESECQENSDSEYNRRNAVKAVTQKLGNSSVLTVSENLLADVEYCNISPDVKVYGNRFSEGNVSVFMGIASAEGGNNILLADDTEFFKDMNGIWNKPLGGNIKIVLFNSFGLDKSAPSVTINCHSASAEGWARSVGFEYISVHNNDELSNTSERISSYEEKPLFVEIFVN